ILFIMRLRSLTTTLFPYTTLFRSTSKENLMRQSISLISRFPTIIAYAYNVYRHAISGRSLHIRHPRENLSLAENFLYMLKRDYRSEEHTSELQSRFDLVCRLLLEK